MKKIDVIYSSKIDKDISITYDSDIHYDMGFTFKGNNVIFTVVPEPEPLNDDRKLGIDPNIFNILIYTFTKVALFINSNTYYVDTDIKRIFV